jgi:hypothetical protein
LLINIKISEVVPKILSSSQFPRRNIGMAENESNYLINLIQEPLNPKHVWARLNNPILPYFQNGFNLMFRPAIETAYQPHQPSMSSLPKSRIHSKKNQHTNSHLDIRNQTQYIDSTWKLVWLCEDLGTSWRD